MTENRFSQLWQSHPDNAEQFLQHAQQAVEQRYRYYQQLAALDWSDRGQLAAAKATCIRPTAEAQP
jgi:pyruvate-ferredoxin/flavodoxin oxidoreductase